MDLNKRMPRIDTSRFAMVPRAEIPRAAFDTTHSVKMTFGFGWLVPLEIIEVLPGDVFNGHVTIFARLATPVFPVMDYLELETFFFFVPNRLVWDNWKRFMGERTNPADSISYTIPKLVSNASGFTPHTLPDYMGLPTIGQVTAGQTVEVNALPFRGYYFIYNEWFRDQNLQNTLIYVTTDAGGVEGNFTMQRRNKKHDYFTSALPWPLKGGVDVTLPMSGVAPITGIAIPNTAVATAGGTTAQETNSASASGWAAYYETSGATTDRIVFRTSSTSAGAAPMIYADLASATGATINALRLAVQTQRFLERDARSGTRYTELLRAHFGVTPEDQRLQRPEYIGGGRTPIQTQAIPQTSATTITGSGSPLGALGAAATASDQHTFSYNATEHGFIIGLVNARAELTYQQGLHRMWTRSTRYDHYHPVFAHLGEQAIRLDEIYATGVDATDALVFGYQERWSEYRYRQSRVAGFFRSTTTSNIDEWHAAQQFTSQPALNSAFLEDAVPAIDRILAAGAAAQNQQILFDSVFRIRTTRAMPAQSIPGMLDRF